MSSWQPERKLVLCPSQKKIPTLQKVTGNEVFLTQIIIMLLECKIGKFKSFIWNLCKNSSPHDRSDHILWYYKILSLNLELMGTNVVCAAVALWLYGWSQLCQYTMRGDSTSSSRKPRHLSISTYAQSCE